MKEGATLNFTGTLVSVLITTKKPTNNTKIIDILPLLGFCDSWGKNPTMIFFEKENQVFSVINFMLFIMCLGVHCQRVYAVNKFDKHTY